MTDLAADLIGWLARPFVHAFDAGRARAGYVAAVRERLVPVMRGDDGGWIAPYVRLRFIARKPI